jgi:hypothetical protein
MRSILIEIVEQFDTALKQIDAERRERQLMRRGPSRPRSQSALNKFAEGK